MQKESVAGRIDKHHTKNTESVDHRAPDDFAPGRVPFRQFHDIVKKDDRHKKRKKSLIDSHARTTDTDRGNLSPPGDPSADQEGADRHHQKPDHICVAGKHIGKQRRNKREGHHHAAEQRAVYPVSDLHQGNQQPSHRADAKQRDRSVEKRKARIPGSVKQPFQPG